MLYDRIKELADNRGMSITALSVKMGWSEKAIYSWRRSSPSIDKVQKVADYFGVSTDYLLGRTDSTHWEQYDKSLGEEKLKSLKESVKDAETNDRSKLIAAHINDDVTEEEMEDIIRYINFLKSKHDM